MNTLTFKIPVCILFAYFYEHTAQGLQALYGITAEKLHVFKLFCICMGMCSAFPNLV